MKLLCGTQSVIGVGNVNLGPQASLVFDQTLEEISLKTNLNELLHSSP